MNKNHTTLSTSYWYKNRPTPLMIATYYKFSKKKEDSRQLDYSIQGHIVFNCKWAGRHICLWGTEIAPRTQDESHKRIKKMSIKLVYWRPRLMMHLIRIMPETFIIFTINTKIETARRLRTGLLLLSFPQSEKWDAGNLDDLELDSGNISLRTMLITESGEENFIVNFNVVKATVTGNEGSNLLGVLDKLHTDGLTDGRVGLLRFNSTERKINMVQELIKIMRVRVRIPIQKFLDSIPQRAIRCPYSVDSSYP